jgi:hypothetical protein
LRFCSAYPLCLLAQDAPKAAPNNSAAPVYTADGRLVFPANYREWIYLTTGMDMDYNPDPAMAGHSMFDNVFVNPEAYKAFVATGTWPNGTMLVLEGRMAANKGSINKAGHYQTNDVMMRSVHVKDARFSGGWAFFGFEGRWQAFQADTEGSGVLFVPRAACSRRYHVCAVLSDAAGDCEEERNAVAKLCEGRSCDGRS